MKKLAVVAFGGNALVRGDQRGTYEERLENAYQTCRLLIDRFGDDCRLVVTHGNGPQVGNGILRHEAGKKEFSLVAMPMDVCVAETQGSIGYMIELGMRRTLSERKLDRKVVTMLTQVEVDRNDPMFDNPTKPVGPFYTVEQASELIAKGQGQYRIDPKGRGWRKVVPSPRPVSIANLDLVKTLSDRGSIVICIGGGGIPVVDCGGYYKGIEAVIDKDLASSMAAIELGADIFYILTDVRKVCLNYRKPDQTPLDVLSVDQAEYYLGLHHFTEGSMAPKIRAAVHFMRNGGKECVITEVNQLGLPNCGTRIVL